MYFNSPFLIFWLSDHAKSNSRQSKTNKSVPISNQQKGLEHALLAVPKIHELFMSF